MFPPAVSPAVASKPSTGLEPVTPSLPWWGSHAGFPRHKAKTQLAAAKNRCRERFLHVLGDAHVTHGVVR